MNNSPTNTRPTDLAVIGLSGRFPGAPDLDTFWHNLCQGQETITFFTDEELTQAGIPADLLHHPRYVKAKAVLEQIELFDAAFFGFSPREAEILDVQHRLFLETAWHALEHAGYGNDQRSEIIGVYAGVGLNSYLLNNIYPNRHQLEAVGGYQVMISNDKDFLPTRTAYKLNLTGPVVAVQTACSTSLVAIHMACQSLLNGECDLALAGGVTVSVPQTAGYLHQEGMILSPDGHCRPFSAQANGTVGGNGVAIVVLKRLEDALQDGDTIHAVVRGSAVNNDGAQKIGYTAPSQEGQANVIREALALADLEPEQIGYIEAHGTGTTLGDPIEMAALLEVFGSSSRQWCAIGSLKSNMGHLDTAAGAAGFIKTVLALKYGQLPPTLHAQPSHPDIPFAQSPFYLNHHLKPWPRTSQPRRAGVSSFGIGGTNAHVVLEEPPAAPPLPAGRSAYLLPLSARTPTALSQMSHNLAHHLQQAGSPSLADTAYTLALGRKQFTHRHLVIASNKEQAVTQLPQPAGLTNNGQLSQPKIGFLFSGQGAQYPGMGQELYQTEPLFRQTIEECLTLCTPFSPLTPQLHQILTSSPTPHSLLPTHLVQPALFILEYALVKLWQSWGITPAAVLGHSLGEYTAACVAGVFSLADGLKLVIERGRLMQSCPAGSMLSVLLSEAELQPYLTAGVECAAVNAPRACVVTGATAVIDQLETALKAQGVSCSRLHTSHAFHSALMEPILAEFEAVVRQIPLHPPQLPLASNLTGRLLTPAEATSPAYWGQQLRQPVQFLAGVQTLQTQGVTHWLEIGPGRTLASLGRQIFPHQSFFTSLRHPQETTSDTTHILSNLGQLWLAGAEVNWRELYSHEKRQRVPLPGYPFERQRYWLDPRPEPAQAAVLPGRQPLDHWFYFPSWRRKTVLSSELKVPSEKQTTLQYATTTTPYSLLPTPHFLALLKLIQQWESDQPGQPLHLTVITSGACAVAGETWLDPEQATLIGLVLTIPREYPHISTRLVDVPPGRLTPQLEKQLQQEFIHHTPERVVAYRDGQRWVQTLEPNPLPAVPGRPALLRPGGTYLITGGCGGIGLTLAHYLAEQTQATLILLNRTPFPGREQWATLTDPAQQQTVRQLQALEAAGGQVHLVAADVANREQMQTVFAKYPQLNGVIHAAGVASGGMLQRKTAEQIASSWQAKVTGTQVLVELLENIPLDFLLFCSSVSAWLGEFGQGDYSAANAYLDAVAQARSRTGRLTISLNWESWQEVGMAARAGVNAPFALTPAEGAELFGRVLQSQEPGVLVSPLPWAERYKLADPAQQPPPSASAPAAVHNRPGLTTNYTPPRDPLETQLAELWQAVLGISPIGVQDDFFALGGHSLLATQLLTRMQEVMGMALPLSHFFDRPTIAQQVAWLAERQLEQVNEDELAALLAEVENLSDEEVARLLGEG